MNVVGRAMLWALVDLLGTSLGVALMAVNPAKTEEGVERDASYLITAAWPASIDADVDLWSVGPSRKPTFYGARDVGCQRLDQDDRGFLDGVVHLADGSIAKVREFKETVSIRCIEPGHTDTAVALYAYHDNGELATAERAVSVPVHFEIIALNPSVRVLFARDVTLERVSQVINIESFIVAPDGRMTLEDAPLENIVERYQRSGSGGYP